MDFASYAQHALALANLRPYDVPSDDTIAAFVADSFPFVEHELAVVELGVLRATHRELRDVMLAPTDAEAVRRMNAVMRRHPISPEISDHPHPGQGRRWHLHLVAGDEPANQMAGSMAMGLLTELLETGLDRRGSCRHETCEAVYLDGSPGGTRRYCSETCQNRANVAAHRARKRAAAASVDDV